MPILHDNDPNQQQVVRCFRCRKVGHLMSQCPRKKRNPRCTTCGGTHKVAKCPINTTPEAVTTGTSEDTGTGKMTLLEHITLLNCIEYSPSHCAKCSHQNPEHLEMECPMYKQGIKCYNWGPRDFVKHHLCHAASEVSWGANADYYEEEWYQGHD